MYEVSLPEEKPRLKTALWPVDLAMVSKVVRVYETCSTVSGSLHVVCGCNLLDCAVDADEVIEWAVQVCTGCG